MAGFNLPTDVGQFVNLLALSDTAPALKYPVPAVPTYKNHATFLPNAFWTGTTGFGFSFWFAVHAWKSNAKLIDCGTGAALNRFTVGFVGTSSALQVTVLQSTVKCTCTLDATNIPLPGASIFLLQWTFVSVSWSATTMKLYLGASLRQTCTCQPTVWAAPFTTCQLGKSMDAASGFSGLIAEFSMSAEQDLK
jgi:hypothetical protein